MNEMTDKQYEEARNTLILLILEIIKNSADITEAEERIRALITKD